MKKQRVLALLLCLALLCTLIPGVFAANDNGMEISKTATANDDGTYTVTLEAYATGSKIISQVKKDIPTDIVLVLDQSGSMAETMDTYGFREYTGKSNDDFYDLRHNGGKENLYYKLGGGSYASVSVSIETGGMKYDPIKNGRNNRSGWNNEYTNYWNNRNNLYALVNGEYQKVTLTTETEGRWNKTTYYVYRLPDGTTIARSANWDGIPSFTGIDGDVLYLATADETKDVYTYTYTDKDGKLQTIGTSTGVNTQPTDFTLYERYKSGNKTRLNALKDAVTTFADSVAKKAAGPDGDITTTEDNVNHRIAMVGFASTSNYANTELLSIAGSNSGRVGIAYDKITTQNNKDVLQNMNETAGQQMISKAIDALDADGSTYIDYGLTMAKNILDANPVAEGSERNRVVVVFTDGSPGYSGDWGNDDYDDADETADKALPIAKSIKADGVTVYTVGIFSGADASDPSNLPGYVNNNSNATQNANRFMHLLSSNYPEATKMNSTGSINPNLAGKSYYLSAGDAGTLNNIFQQISNQIESGGSSTTLGSQTVIKDIISPAFTLPAGTTASDITLETYACTGKNGDTYAWSKNANAMGAAATVSGDQVSVTGFDFAANYVGTVTENGDVTYRGDKLVISFKVTPKAGFLGGNNVYTNTKAGVYENGSAAEPVLTFERPQVNVPIEDVTVTAADKNVYLLDSLTGAQLKDGATATVGAGGKNPVTLDLSKADENYGLELWQTEYVNITVEIKDKDGNAITGDLSGLTDDTTYSISVKVEPKADANDTSSGIPAVAKSGKNKPDAKINVFKPTVTFKDSEAWYGGDVPTGVNSNLTETKWLHGADEADTTKMGTAPALTLTGTPDSSKIADGKINTKQDVPVDVAVKIGETDVTGKATFAHTACTDASIDCSWKETTLDGSPAFLLHVKTCQLTVTKANGVSGEPYVFTVKKDGTKYTEVTVVGNGSETIYELPVGTYTIAEDTGWSWRYSANNGGSASLTAVNPTGSITCTNHMEKPYWLNGFSEVETNIFGISK